MPDGRTDKGTFCGKDRTGERYGNYVIKSDTGRKDSTGSRIWLAVCDCGKTFEVSAGRVNSVKSCGCQNKQYKPKELKGKIVRSIRAIEKTEKHSNGYTVWKAECMLCGNIKEFPSYYFTRVHVSCNCAEWKAKYSDVVGRKPLPNSQAHVNSLFASYRKAAKDRGYYFKLSKEEFRQLVEGDCYYCGAKPRMRQKHNLAGEYASNGIDRMDNSKGYDIDNCVSCCATCNIAKGVRDKDEFLEWVKRVYAHSVKEGVVL